MGDNKKGSLADQINWGGKDDDKKKKKGKKEKSLLDKMKFYRNGGAKKMESVTVSAPDSEGIEKGLDFAKKLIEKKEAKGEEFGCGGKKYEDGGMKREMMRKMGKSDDTYTMPESLKEAMKKTLGKSSSKSEDKYEMPDDLKKGMDKLKSSFLKRKKRK